MMVVRLAAGVLFLAIASSSLSSSKARAERRLTMEQAVDLALQRNAELRIQSGEVAGARARLAGASVLLQRNPEVDVEVGRRSRGGGQSPEYAVTLSQPIEIAGQRGARVDAARAGIDAADARVRMRRLDLAAEVRETFGRALAADRRVSLAEEAVALAGKSVETAQQRFQAGDASRIEVNAARIEIGRARRELRLGHQRRVAAVAGLRRLLALPPRETLVLEGELRETEERPVDLEALVKTAVTRRPEALAFRRELEAVQAERRLATREAIPTPRIGATIARDEGDRILLGVLSLELPLFTRNQGARGLGDARIDQARVSLEAAERQVEEDVRVAAARYQAALAAARDYSGEILKAVEENLELVNEGYAAGKIDFLQLLLIRRETLDARRDYIETLEELNSARAELGRAVGREEGWK